MKKQMLRIATRQSALALWQANFIKQQLEKKYPNLSVELLGMTTTGDKLSAGSLKKVGGKNLFVKELEQALLDHQADIAVHSMKDVPMDVTDGLTIAAITEREDPRDVLISNKYKNLAALPPSAVVGTSSLRRTCQLYSLRSDLTIRELRGNVDTRIKRLDEQQYDAIVLAAAGLIRLGLQNRITEYLSSTVMLPAVGQGALGIECRSDDVSIIELIKPLNHSETHFCITAERSLNKQLNGGCQVPVAAHAVLINDKIKLQGLVGKPEGSLILKAEREDFIANAELLGLQVANDLLQQGAEKILREIK